MQQTARCYCVNVTTGRETGGGVDKGAARWRAAGSHLGPGPDP